ncbi:TetR/AcrR family transcriptional regulator [Tropicibacter sp. Alg240-R139]|uniref:TetR/AcrR family transcriptional regulator n=1 Tax=Tropicibacter sp. Alg240-R139 TaxID=2305991 RepID=UPI0013E0AF8B|nr:TetR/AcrR family transcriptional regulator [Tropicibacter sp. Alg240-R139]
MSQTAVQARSERYEELLRAAAECFQSRGFAATSIDTVARHLGATKGRVYHYFPSKMDLFNAVRERAMDLVFAASDDGYAMQGSPAERLYEMSAGHVRSMIDDLPYMHVLVDGLQMLRYSTTTQFQREAMEAHLARRDVYEQRFREVVVEGVADGQLHVGPQLSVTIQSFMGTLNGPVFWYRPRGDDTSESRQAIVDDVVRFALSGLGLNEESITLYSSQSRKVFA